MSLFVYFIVALILVGVALYCINNLIPMDPRVKTFINIAIVVGLLLWSLNFFGLTNGLWHFHTCR